MNRVDVLEVVLLLLAILSLVRSVMLSDQARRANRGPGGFGDRGHYCGLQSSRYLGIAVLALGFVAVAEAML